MQNERMPPRKDASESASPADGSKTNNTHSFASWVLGGLFVLLFVFNNHTIF